MTGSGLATAGLPADRQPSVFSQALRAGYGAAGFEAADQGKTGRGDARPRYRNSGADRTLSEATLAADRTDVPVPRRNGRSGGCGKRRVVLRPRGLLHRPVASSRASRYYACACGPRAPRSCALSYRGPRRGSSKVASAKSRLRHCRMEENHPQRRNHLPSSRGSRSWLAQVRLE